MASLSRCPKMRSKPFSFWRRKQRATLAPYARQYRENREHLVRAAQDLNLAGQSRLRVEKFLNAMGEVPMTRSKRFMSAPHCSHEV